MTVALADVVNQLLAELGSQPDGQPWRLGALNVCELAYDEIELVLEFIPELGRLAISTTLSAAIESIELSGDANTRESFSLAMLRRLVKANFLGAETGGATLFVNPATFEVSFGISLPVEALVSQRLQSILLGLVDQARHWQCHLPSAQSHIHTPEAMRTDQLLV